MLGEHSTISPQKGEGTGNGAKEKSTGVLRVDRAIYDEIVAFQKEQSLESLTAAANQLWFARLAAQQDPAALSEHDEALSPFRLAVKHFANQKAIDALIKTARLELLRKQSAFLDIRMEKAKAAGVEIRYEDRIKYACPMCSETFDAANAAIVHFNTVHDAPQNKALGHLCPFCPTEKSFDSIGDLRTHIKTYHKDQFPQERPPYNPPPSPIPPMQVKEKVIEKTVYACPCGARFNSDMERAVHMAKCPWLAQYVAKHATAAGGIRA